MNVYECTNYNGFKSIRINNFLQFFFFILTIKNRENQFSVYLIDIKCSSSLSN